jgi:hypothetical protein
MKKIFFLVLLSLASLTAFPQIWETNNIVRNNALKQWRTANALDVMMPFTTTGTDTYVIAVNFTNPTYAPYAGGLTYETGDKWTIRIGSTNTSAVTSLQVNSEAAIPLKDATGNNFAVGGLAGGTTHTFSYNGTSFLEVSASGVGGGGGGSGTVNSGTQYRLAYYATGGTGISEAGAITAARALKSDANGVPTHFNTATEPTLTELTYVKGVTSAIQTQFTAKANLASPTFTGTVVLPSTSSIGTVSATELTYLDNVTSDIQTQFTAKADLASPTFSGTVVLPSTTSIGTVSATELTYLDNVTSSIQTQLNLLAPLASPTFTGTVVLPSTSSIGTVSATELTYLDNVTSAIQTQFTGKADLASPTFSGTVVLPSTTSIGTVSSTEVGYLDNVTSAIQTQFTAKANLASPTFTGTVVLPSTSSIGTVSATELSYLDNVTSAIQTQFAGKEPTLTSATPSTAGATITLDLNSLTQRVFVGSASFATSKTIVFSNDTNALVFNFHVNITSVAATLIFPANVAMSSSDWNTATQTWTPPSTGEYLVTGGAYGANWKVIITGPYN